jgi:hypothetical protein
MWPSHLDPVGIVVAVLVVLAYRSSRRRML